MENEQASFSGWARVEVMGHQTHIGHCVTEAYGQAVMFRVDQPELPEREYILQRPDYADGRYCPIGTTVKRPAIPGCSVLIGAGSIYRIIPCTQEAALKAIDQTIRPDLKLVSLPEQAALPLPQQLDDMEETRAASAFSEEEDDSPF